MGRRRRPARTGRQAAGRRAGSIRPVAVGAAGLAVVGAAAGLAYYRRPLAVARELLRLRLRLAGGKERTVEAAGLPIRYLEAGPRRTQAEPAPGAAAIVLIHGFGDSAETWIHLLPPLAAARRVLAPDLPGFGRTPIPPEGMRFGASVRYLDAFLDALGVERAVLVGNSLGGAIALRYAADRPERVAELFLLAPAGLHGEPPAVLEPATREMARELVEVVSGPGQRTPRFILDDILRRANDPARRAALRSPEPVDVSQDLPRITAPTTIVWGDRDGLIPLENGERMRAAIAGAELIVLPGVAHVPQLQAPHEVVAIIRDRLGRGAPSPATQRNRSPLPPVEHAEPGRGQTTC